MRVMIDEGGGVHIRMMLTGEGKKVCVVRTDGDGATKCTQTKNRF